MCTFLFCCHFLFATSMWPTFIILCMLSYLSFLIHINTTYHSEWQYVQQCKCEFLMWMKLNVSIILNFWYFHSIQRSIFKFWMFNYNLMIHSYKIHVPVWWHMNVLNCLKSLQKQSDMKKKVEFCTQRVYKSKKEGVIKTKNFIAK